MRREGGRGRSFSFAVACIVEVLPGSILHDIISRNFRDKKTEVDIGFGKSGMKRRYINVFTWEDVGC